MAAPKAVLSGKEGAATMLYIDAKCPVRKIMVNDTSLLETKFLYVHTTSMKVRSA